MPFLAPRDSRGPLWGLEVRPAPRVSKNLSTLGLGVITVSAVVNVVLRWKCSIAGYCISYILFAHWREARITSSLSFMCT